MNEHKSVPNIRFRCFEANWREKNFQEILTINSGKDYKNLSIGNIPVYGTGGLMLYVNESLSNKDAVGIGRKGTINKPQYLRAPFWTVDTLFFMIPRKNFDISFIFCLSQKINWKKYDESTGLPSLSKKVISKISSYVPEIKEQQKIGDFFTKLDKLLDLQQQKIDKLELLKKALLQKLFPKHDAKIPELRFKGFEDEWEPKCLGKLGFFESGNGFPKNEQGKKIGIPFFKVSDLGSSFKLTKAKNYVAPEQIKSNKWKVIDPTKNGAIVFAKIGAAIFLNRKRLVMKPFLIDNNLMAYVISENVNRNFVMANIQMINFSKFVQVGAIPSINSGDLKKIKISQPINLSEQQKIGSLLSKVDQLIELENKKLQDFQQVKKCLLQNMFVE